MTNPEFPNLWKVTVSSYLCYLHLVSECVRIVFILSLAPGMSVLSLQMWILSQDSLQAPFIWCHIPEASSGVVSAVRGFRKKGVRNNKRHTTSASRAWRHLLVLPRPNGSKSISKSAKPLEETNTGCICTNCELVQLLILNGCNAAMQCRLLTFSHLVEAIHPNRVWIVMIEKSMLQQTSGGFPIDCQWSNPNTIWCRL